ncbi:small terminase subunit [Limosilactobacillus reuteri]|uniref:small terminase subunit n=1 Tax=Limosilactobacillus reuteri TaxID=1598 RepID=UPI001E39CA8B|nr:small terminase subunit [Limosilactobacillus reuteri]MCC4501090.1 small terminase subunit [Limosilactobacillus reuteri]MCC4505311.1 small terminase subunit [Limosilactobacillus reuteri]MCC4507275.1 small terminase subunit [Limosilactobacillus reuteri]
MAKGQYQKWLEDDNLILLQGWKRNGLTDEQIAHNIGVTPRTLENWKNKYVQIFRALKVGKEQANFAVEGKLFQRAMSGNTTAMIFWLKNNWRDKYNDSELSPEERKLAVARMKKLEAETKNVQLRNKSLEENGADVEEALDRLLTRLDKEESKDEHERPADS